MPKLTGIFDRFKDLDAIPVADVISSLKIKGDPHIVQNFIGNRILYPQTLAVTSYDLEIDHKILTEALKKQPGTVYDKAKQTLILIDEHTSRFPPFIKLVATVIDAVNPEGLTGLFLKDGRTLRLGTIVSSSLARSALPGTGVKDLTVQIDGVVKNLTPNAINLLPHKGKQLKLKLGVLQEIILPGGEMGIFLDLRGI